MLHLLRGAFYRQSGDYNRAVDELLMALEMCGYDESCSVYSTACRQLVLTYNDFAVFCFQ